MQKRKDTRKNTIKVISNEETKKGNNESRQKERAKIRSRLHILACGPTTNVCLGLRGFLGV
jgi:hypothetical protein